MYSSKSNTSRSVRSSLLISYAVILMIPILFHFIVFFINMKNLQQQSDLVFSATNEQLTDFINTYVEEVHTSSSAIILSDAAQNLMNYTAGERTIYQINQFRDLQKELSYKTIVCDYISSIYVVFPKSHTILTEQSIYYDYNFTYKCRYSLGMTLEEWQDFISFDGYERVSILHSWLDGTDHILVAQKNRSTSDRAPEMLVVTEINADSIRNILNELSMDGRLRTLLYDRESGVVLSSSLPGNGSAISYETGEDGISAARAIISAEDTDHGNWQCVILTPRSTYLSSFLSLFIGMAVYLVVCTIVGIWVIRYMTQKQYTPLEKLTKSLLSTMEQGPHSTEANEYE